MLTGANRDLPDPDGNVVVWMGAGLGLALWGQGGWVGCQRRGWWLGRWGLLFGCLLGVDDEDLYFGNEWLLFLHFLAVYLSKVTFCLGTRLYCTVLVEVHLPRPPKPQHTRPLGDWWKPESTSECGGGREGWRIR